MTQELVHTKIIYTFSLATCDTVLSQSAVTICFTKKTYYKHVRTFYCVSTKYDTKYLNIEYMMLINTKYLYSDFTPSLVAQKKGTYEAAYLTIASYYY